MSLQLFKKMNKSTCQAYNLCPRTRWFLQGSMCRTRILCLWNDSLVSKQRSLFHNSWSVSSTFLICLKHLLHKYTMRWLIECQDWARIEVFFFLFLVNQNVYGRELWYKRNRSGLKLYSHWSSDQSLKSQSICRITALTYIHLWFSGPALSTKVLSNIEPPCKDLCWGMILLQTELHQSIVSHV